MRQSSLAELDARSRGRLPTAADSRQQLERYHCMAKHTPRKPTISELLVPWADDDQLADLETYRIQWEQRHGPVDLTRYYTSRWPSREQDTLYRIDFKAYFEALPTFVQDMIRDRVRTAAREGRGDDLADEYIRLYFHNHMKGPGGPPHSR